MRIIKKINKKELAHFRLGLSPSYHQCVHKFANIKYKQVDNKSKQLETSDNKYKNKMQKIAQKNCAKLKNHCFE